MKGGAIYSKHADFISKLNASLSKNNITYMSDGKSVRILSDDDNYILVYGQTGPGDEFYDDEMPLEALQQGYRYYFLADCRSEEFFTKIFGNPALGLEILVSDNNGVIFKPDELDATKLRF